jgi:hypothetical protein
MESTQYERISIRRLLRGSLFVRIAAQTACADEDSSTPRVDLHLLEFQGLAEPLESEAHPLVDCPKGCVGGVGDLVMIEAVEKCHLDGALLLARKPVQGIAHLSGIWPRHSVCHLPADSWWLLSGSSLRSTLMIDGGVANEGEEPDAHGLPSWVKGVMTIPDGDERVPQAGFGRFSIVQHPHRHGGRQPVVPVIKSPHGRGVSFGDGTQELFVCSLVERFVLLEGVGINHANDDLSAERPDWVRASGAGMSHSRIPGLHYSVVPTGSPTNRSGMTRSC